MTNHEENTLGKLEALFFIHGEPIGISEIAGALDVSVDVAKELLADFSEALKGEGRGLMLLAHGDKFQLVTKPETSSVLTEFVREELSSELTPASVEALAIVMYLGPISKAKIEYYRGVNSAVILRNLGLRGLINRIPDPEKPSGWLYEPSFEFLKHVGIARKEDMPDFLAFKEKFDRRQMEQIQ